MGDASQTRARYLAKGLSVLRFLVMLSVYAGALAVVCAVFTLEHPDGKEHTIPVSPMMQCVINLSFQYFFIYILLWIFFTVDVCESTSFLSQFFSSCLPAAEPAAPRGPL